MIILKRVTRSIWRGICDDPQELAQADSALRGVKPNPEGYPKDADGKFYFETVLHQFDANFPWDEVHFDSFQKTFKAVP